MKRTIKLSTLKARLNDVIQSDLKTVENLKGIDMFSAANDWQHAANALQTLLEELEEYEANDHNIFNYYN